MSATIDERIVRMEFDNKEFEKNVATSLSTLDKLKNALTFTKQKEQISTLSSAIGGMTGFEKFSDSIDVVKTKFSALEIAGITAISKITSQAIDAGERMVKSLSIDQIATGWDKYARITSSVQTILAATKEQGETMESVTEQIEKLSWFTDETSYSLNDMTDNIAKFTSNGIELKSATTEMQGIAVAAALAGANTQEASHAMSGFSKAMGEGAMKRQHWQWIQTAHVDTMQFKQTLIDTAVELGTLKEVGEGVYETLEGNEVTVSNFETAMKDAWITTDVMSNTLELYGAFSDQLYEASQMTGLTASELLDALEKYQNGGLDLNQLAKETGKSVEDLSMIMQVLDQDALDLGNRAFRAAQEAKTFQEAIDSVKDAVSSGWMKTFEIIFGNYEEAKVLWTDFANAMYDVFAESGNVRNEILGLWKELGGRDVLIEGLTNAFHALVDPLNAVKEGFASVFPDEGGMAQNLYDLTVKFRDFTETMLLSEENLKRIHDTFANFGEIVKQVFATTKDFVYAVSPLTKVLSALIDSVIKIAGAFKSLFDKIKNRKKTTKDTVNVFETMHDKIDAVADVLVNAIEKVTEFIENLIDNRLFEFIDFFGNAVEKIKSFNEETGILTKTIEILGTVIAAPFYLLYNLVTIIGSFINKMLSLPEVQRVAKNVLEEIATFVSNIYEKFKALIDYVKTTDPKKFFEDIKTWFRDTKKAASDFFDNLGDRFVIVKEIKEEIEKAIENFRLLTGGVSAHTLYDELEEPMSDAEEATFNLRTALEEATEKVKTFFKTIDTDKLIAVGFAVAMTGMFISVWRLVSSFKELTDVAKGTLKSIRSPFDALATTIKSYGKKQESKFKEIAESIFILSAALAVLALMDAKYHENLINAAVMLGALGVALTLFVGVFTFFSKRLKKANSFKELLTLDATMLAFSSSLIILSGALKILEGVDFYKAQYSIFMIAEMGAVMAALTIVLTRFVGNGMKGFLSLLVFAFTINKFAQAVKDISQANFKNAQDNIWGLIAIFGGLALVAVAASKIGVFSAAGLFITLLALDKFIPIVKDVVANADFAGGIDNVLRVLERHVDLIKTVGIIAIAMTAVSAYLGGGIKKFGAGMLMFGLALVVMAKAIDVLGSIDVRTAQKGIEVIKQVFVIFGIMSLILGALNGGSKAIKISLAIGLMTLALYPIAGAIWILAKMAEKGHNVDQAAKVIENIMFCFSLIIAAAALGDSKVSFGSIIAITSGIAILAAELIVLSLLPIENIKMAGFALSIVLTTFAVLLYSFGKMGNQAHPIAVIFQMISMGALLIVLGDVLKELSVFTWDSVLSAAGSLAIVLLALGAVFKIISDSKDQITLESIASYIGISLSLIPIAIAIAALSAFGGRWDDMLAAAVSMSIVLLSLGEVFKIISNSESISKSDVISYWKLCLSLAPITLAIIALTNLGGSWDKMLASALSLSLVLLALSASFKIIASSSNKATLKDAESFLLMSLSLIPIAGAVLLLSRYGGSWLDMLSSAASMSLVLLALGGVFAILSKVGGKAGIDIAASAKTAIAFAVFIDVLVGILGATGYLVGLIPPSVFNKINEGLNRMILIMYKIGDMIGSFIGGIWGSAAEKALDGIGEGLTKFADKADYFIKWLKTVDQDVVDGAVNLAKALLLFGASEVIDAVAGWLVGTESDSVINMFETLGEGVKGFANAVTGLNTGGMKAAAEVATTLFELPIPREGGLIQDIIGEKSLGNFNEETLTSFAKGIVAFATTVDGIDETKIEGGISIARSLFSLDPPNEGGIIAHLIGDNDLGKFGPDTLGKFGEGIQKFASYTNGITYDMAVGAIDIAIALFDLDPPNSGGFIEAIVGGNDYDRFNAEVLGKDGFAGGIAAFVEGVKGIKASDADGGLRVIERLFETELPTVTYGLTDLFMRDDYKYFKASRLGKKGFGGGIAAFVDAVKDVTYSKAMGGLLVTKELFSIELPTVTYGITDLFARKDYKYFKASRLGEKGLGGGIAAFVNAVSDLGTDSLNKAQNAADILKVLDGIEIDIEGGIIGLGKALMTGGTDFNIQKLSSFFGQLGGAVTNFYNNIKDVNLSSLTAAVRNLEDIKNVLTEVKSFDTSKLTSFTDAMNSAGDLGIKSFCDAFTNAQEQIDTAIATFAVSVANSVKTYQPVIDSSMEGMANGSINALNSSLGMDANGFSQEFYDPGYGSLSSFTDGALNEEKLSELYGGYENIPPELLNLLNGQGTFSTDMLNTGNGGLDSFVTGALDEEKLSELYGGYENIPNTLKEILHGKNGMDMDSSGVSSWLLGDGKAIPTSLGTGATDEKLWDEQYRNIKGKIDGVKDVIEGKNGLDKDDQDMSSWLIGDGKTVPTSFGTGANDENLWSSQSKSIGDRVKDIIKLFDPKITRAEGQSYEDMLKVHGINTLNGYDQGLNDSTTQQSIFSKFSGWVKSLTNIWPRNWDQNSPSKLAMEQSGYTVEGYALGFENNYGRVVDAASGLGEEAYNALSSSTDQINDYVAENLDLNPSVTPFLDVSGLQRDANNINSLFEDSQGLTINSHLGAMTDMFGEMNTNSLMSNNQIVSSLQSLHEDVQNLQNVVGNLQVIMDSGSLVGAIAPNMDVALGQMAMYKRRGM